MSRTVRWKSSTKYTIRNHRPETIELPTLSKAMYHRRMSSMSSALKIQSLMLSPTTHPQWNPCAKWVTKPFQPSASTPGNSKRLWSCRNTLIVYSSSSLKEGCSLIGNILESFISAIAPSIATKSIYKNREKEPKSNLVSTCIKDSSVAAQRTD